MITLYAITDHPTPPVPSLGAMRVIASGDLAAVCGPALEAEVTADALWQHERLVEALMDGRDVLPVRYGTCLPDDAAAIRTLDDNRTEFAAALEAVRGAVELAVRVFAGADDADVADADVADADDADADDADADDAGAVKAGTATASQATMTGTAYLRARARLAADESGAAAIVHQSLARAARAATLARVNRPGELMRAAYLVDRDAAGAFSESVRAIQEENPQLRITCTGPWPPYSFAKS